MKENLGRATQVKLETARALNRAIDRMLIIISSNHEEVSFMECNVHYCILW